MPEQRKCDGCGKLYWWPAAGWQHKACVVVVREIRTGIAETSAPEQGDCKVQHQERMLDGGVGKKQRWDKDKYNAYQRDLMRKRRAEAKSKPA